MLGIMKALLILALVFCVFSVFALAGAVGLGLLLTVCVPGLGLGDAVVAGSVVTVFALYYLVEFLRYGAAGDDIPYDEPLFLFPSDFFYRRPRKPKTRRKKK